MINVTNQLKTESLLNSNYYVTAHAELVMVHPEKFCRYAEKFLTMQAEEI